MLIVSIFETLTIPNGDIYATARKALKEMDFQRVLDAKTAARRLETCPETVENTQKWSL
jgi:hypothetical protein